MALSPLHALPGAPTSDFTITERFVGASVADARAALATSVLRRVIMRAHGGRPGRDSDRVESRRGGAETAEHPDTVHTVDGQAYAPTPLVALGLPEVPTEYHFVRSHLPVPDVDVATWTLTVEGDWGPLVLGLEQLRLRPPRTLPVVLECAGHRRDEFEPPAPGLPWSTGAVCEASWTGVGLGPLLRQAGIPRDARGVVLEGADCGPFDGAPGEHPFARSLPLNKALAGEVLVAHAMNGRPISVARGGPVRAVVPGFYATDSVKWLRRIWFTAEPFDGPFEALDYRLRMPGEPGAGQRLYELPISSLIAAPAPRLPCPAGLVTLRGIAWGGEGGVAAVRVSIDGAWSTATLKPARGRFARTHWELVIPLRPGRHQVASCAVDGAGGCQPAWPEPNQGGYANHAVHRIELIVSEFA